MLDPAPSHSPGLSLSSVPRTPVHPKPGLFPVSGEGEELQKGPQGGTAPGRLLEQHNYPSSLTSAGPGGIEHSTPQSRPPEGQICACVLLNHPLESSDSVPPASLPPL